MDRKTGARPSTGCSSRRTALLCLALTGFWACGAPTEVGPTGQAVAAGVSPSTPDPADTQADDMEPRLVPFPKRDLDAAPLAIEDATEFRVGPTEELPRRLGVAFTASLVFFFDRTSPNKVWAFNYNGGLERTLVAERKIKRGTEMAVASDASRFILVQPGVSMEERDQDFKVLNRTAGPEMKRVSGIAVVPHVPKDVLTLFPDYGFHLGLMDKAGHLRTFHVDRPPPQGSERAYRYSLLPFVFVDADSSGNMYVAEHVAYDIRKYDRTGKYLGDFAVQSDQGHYLEPPASVDKLRLQLDREYGKEWGSSWTSIGGVAIAADRSLVVSFTLPDKRTRLHFYTLDGAPAYLPMTVDWQLSGRDPGGALYFLDSKEPSRVLLRRAKLTEE